MYGPRVDWQTLIQPTSEPITLNEAKSFCRVDFTNDDALLASLISQARVLAEQTTGQALAIQTMQVLYTFPPAPLHLWDEEATENSTWIFPASSLCIPIAPLQSVSMVEYRAGPFESWQSWSQTSGSITNWQTEAISQQLSMQNAPAAFQYRLTCLVGYTSIPDDLKLMLLELIAYAYDHREGSGIPTSTIKMLKGRRRWLL